MSGNILVAYSTNSGSTEEVAQAIAQELGKDGSKVDVSRVDQVASLDGYQSVVVGGPMILGWHRAAAGFVRKHAAELATRKVAYFATAMSLTQTGETRIGETPLCIDPGLAKEPQHPGRLGIKERYALPANYLKPMLGAAKDVHPVSVAFFGGKLELFRLNILQMLFVMVIVGAPPGDLRNWSVVEAWAAELRDALNN